MKKLLATILCCAMLVSVTACSAGNNDNTEPTATSATTSTEPIANTEAEADTKTEMTPDEIKAHIDAILKKKKYEGIVYLTQNGKVVYESATGKDETGNNLTVSSSMYIGSVSKQFCATAIMMLKEQGKLSVDDTLDKYFPDYQYGKDITIKNLLTMRSGIPESPLEESYDFFENTSELNTEPYLNWIFNMPLNFEPDTDYEYSNPNYLILSCIVEQVSGQNYHDFIRENIFKPLEMSNTGFIHEVKDSPEWVTGLDNSIPLLSEFEGTFTTDEFNLLTRGAGDIVSNAYDMDKWMSGLVSGKLISRESYQEMTDNYTTEYALSYGYGLTSMYHGVGHGGDLYPYTSMNYINEEYGYNLFVINNVYYQKHEDLMLSILEPLVYE